MNNTITTAPKQPVKSKEIDRCAVALMRRTAELEETLRKCGKRNGSAMYDEAGHQCVIAIRVSSSAFVALSKARSESGVKRLEHFNHYKLLQEDLENRHKQIGDSILRAIRRESIAGKNVS